MALGIIFNTFNGIQKFVPGYTNALQQHVEGNKFTYEQLRSLSQSSTTMALSPRAGGCCRDPVRDDPAKVRHGPQVVGIVKWLNTPGDQPLTLCYCAVTWCSFTSGRIRALIANDRCLTSRHGTRATTSMVWTSIRLVQAPEFAFEHVISNIKSAAKSLGVKYPIAVDNNLTTWTAYSNQYWPAEYLIDAKGVYPLCGLRRRELQQHRVAHPPTTRRGESNREAAPADQRHEPHPDPGDEPRVVSWIQLRV